MNKDKKQPQSKDEVDDIVDALVADPRCANDVKALLRRKIAAPDIVHMVAPRVPSSKTSVSGEESDDDVWDNMPV